MTAPRSLPDPIVVCPLEYERRSLERAGVGRLSELDCCGPGAERLGAWAERLGGGERVVILAGLAGALHSKRPAGTAWQVTGVHDAQRDEPWVPTFDLAGRADGQERCVVTSTTGTVLGPVAKERLAGQTGADLVDLESVVFARAATRLGWRWGIVRGVSDGVDEALPGLIDRWIDERGRSRPGAVALALLRRPGWMPGVIRLAGQSRSAMRAVAARVVEILERGGVDGTANGRGSHGLT